MLPLVLASASPRRRDLMMDAGYLFSVAAAGVNEDSAETPESLPALTEANAALKARWVAERRPGTIAIGADTLVYLDGRALGKPRDLPEATAMLARLNGRTHQVCTGVCLASRDPDRDQRFHVISEVTFRKLSPDAIAAYLQLIDPLDKAGAYAAQDHGDLIIDRVEGSWTNVVGLPMDELASALETLARS
ncbi:Maf family protein [soil metagenome]